MKNYYVMPKLEVVNDTDKRQFMISVMEQLAEKHHLPHAEVIEGHANGIYEIVYDEDLELFFLNKPMRN